MRTLPMILVTGLALLGSAACGLFGLGDVELNDGEECSVDDDCSTGYCTSANLCSHTACECPSGDCVEGGEQTSDCREGWLCVGYDHILDPVKEFFGGKGNPSDGYCQPTCADGCPDHYVCNGDFCSAEDFWNYPDPTVTWSGDATGEFSGRDESTTVMVEEGSVITLTGSGISPVGAAIVEFNWTTVSQAGDYMELEGAAIEITVPAGYRRVELDATDSESRTGRVTVVFQSL